MHLKKEVRADKNVYRRGVCPGNSTLAKFAERFEELFDDGNSLLPAQYSLRPLVNRAEYRCRTGLHGIRGVWPSGKSLVLRVMPQDRWLCFPVTSRPHS
jgi:hypothetical protein